MDGDKKVSAKVDLATTVKEMISQKTWLEALQTEPNASKLIKDTAHVFYSYQKPFIHAIRSLCKTDDALTLEKMLGEDKELIFAILL